MRLPEADREVFLGFRARLSAELKKARKERGVTVAEAAKRMGVTKRTVTEWEAGVMPTIETLDVYCRLIGHSLAAIISRAGE